MPYVQRENNKIIGTYACLQEGYAEEWLDDDSPELHPVPTIDDISKQFSDAIQTYMDDAARGRGYDNILSACSYAYPGNTFQAESESFVVWRSAVWNYCYGELQKVKDGTRTMPTVEQIISELPERILP